MPTVAVVEGMKVQFYANEHPPPHFHVTYAEHQAIFSIDKLEMTEGFLPPAKRRSIVEWAASRRLQLSLAFVQAISHDPVEPIE